MAILCCMCTKTKKGAVSFVDKEKMRQQRSLIFKQVNQVFTPDEITYMESFFKKYINVVNFGFGKGK